MNRRSFTKGIVATAASLSLVACFGLAGCGSSSSGSSNQSAEPAVELQIFAANSLEKALPEVQALYTEQTGVTFADTQFKASGDLVAQLEGGASADILITASTSTMDKAVADGFVAEALESAGLCTTKTADDGTITVTYDKSIADKINDGADKVGTVASYVNEGQCDVGLVYTSDLYRYDGIKSIFTTPADSHKDILYPGAAITDSANADAAAEFLDFCLNNADAQKIWQEYGFELA